MPTLLEATLYFTPFIYTLSVIAIIHTSWTTIRQINVKKIIAYSSVAHMNFVAIGTFSLNIQGIEGSILLMLSHGMVSSALFYVLVFYMTNKRLDLLNIMKVLVITMPMASTIFLFFTLANMSLPWY